MTRERIAELVDPLLELCLELSATLGYQGERTERRAASGAG
jgi:hypothetical protein